MRQLTKFPLEGDGAVVVEVDEQDPGFDRAARGDRIAEASETFQDALERVRPAVEAVIDRFRTVTPNEIQVEFGIRLTIKAGAVITSSEGEGHFQVRLTWTHK